MCDLLWSDPDGAFPSSFAFSFCLGHVRVHVLVSSLRFGWRGGFVYPAFSFPCVMRTSFRRTPSTYLRAYRLPSPPCLRPWSLTRVTEARLGCSSGGHPSVLFLRRGLGASWNTPSISVLSSLQVAPNCLERFLTGPRPLSMICFFLDFIDSLYIAWCRRRRLVP
jgi:hypothetical protein